MTYKETQLFRYTKTVSERTLLHPFKEQTFPSVEYKNSVPNSHRTVTSLRLVMCALFSEFYRTEKHIMYGKLRIYEWHSR